MLGGSIPACLVSGELITLVRCGRLQIELEESEVSRGEARRDEPPLLSAHHACCLFKTRLKRINYCKCKQGSQACNTRHICSLGSPRRHLDSLL